MTKTKSAFIIGTLIITIGAYGGMKELVGASSITANTENDLTHANIAELMTTMKIYSMKEPVPPPKFSLMSISGDQINLGDFNGKVVLLSFWATW